jgi:hypothetical protein
MKYDLTKVPINEWLKVNLTKNQKEWLRAVQKYRKKNGIRKKTLNRTQLNMLEALGK